MVGFLFVCLFGLIFSIGKLIKEDKSVTNCLAMIAYVCQGKNVMRGIEFIIRDD